MAGAHAVELVYAKDGSGVFGYKDTPKLPWCQWLVHDPDRPAPKRVDPVPAGPPAPVPADAIVLFDGKDLLAVAAFRLQGRGGLHQCRAMTTSQPQTFGNCQIHVEWMAPAHFKGDLMNQGNNGVLLMGLYEIQVFDSYNVKIYPDGQAAGIYGQTPPLVNATRPPGQWQTYDIVFIAPVFDGEKLVSPARVTVFHNGLLALLNEEIHGETFHRRLPEYIHKISRGPLVFGGHHCPVRFRDVWVRPL